MSSVFTKIIQREIPSTVIYEDDVCIVIETIEPLSPIHWLLIPKEEIPTVLDMHPDHSAVMGHLFLVSQQLAKKHGIVGYKLHTNVGTEGGQEVMHIHVHMMAGAPLSMPQLLRSDV